MRLRDAMTRAFEIDEWELRADGQFVDGRIVPYNRPTEIVERNRETGELMRYSEQFLPHSCLAMAQSVAKRGNAAFISFLMEHEEHDFNAKIGYATDLRDADDGAHATFKLYPGNDLDKVRAMLNESHKGLSLMFGDVRPPKVIDGIVSRVQVHISHVAATPTPCYADALITGMRADDEMPAYATPMLNEVTEWLASIRK